MVKNVFDTHSNAGLVDAIREDVSMLTLLAEVLCLLDMIVNSFAHTISTKPVDRYTRPNFTGKQTCFPALHSVLMLLNATTKLTMIDFS